jgi:flavorubredoxin
MTSIDEIADGIYRVFTPVAISGAGGFSFNQYLIVDDEPLLFHTGPRRLWTQLNEAVSRVMPVERLRWLALSHFEADECGALNRFLQAAPQAEPLCCARWPTVSSATRFFGAPVSARHLECGDPS